VQCVGGDHDLAQVGDGIEHRDEGGQLVAADHLNLGEHQVLGVVEDGEQLGLIPALVAGATQRLTVHSQHRPVLAAGSPAVGVLPPAALPAGQDQPVRGRCSATGSTAASTRPNVVACGVGAQMATACSAQRAHWAIAA
jgi:hypothetical protein